MTEDPLHLPRENSEDRLALCQTIIGHRFADEAILRRALTHSSSKTEEEPSNERLEFLGDSILGMVVSDYLYRTFPDHDEGELTKVKSAVVASSTLAGLVDRLDIAGLISVGKGMAMQEQFPRSLLANLFEALIGAVYLDAGLEEARAFILRHLQEELNSAARDEHRRNFKSILQHFAQKEYGLTPTYRVTHEEGPDHCKSFEVVAVIGEKSYEVGQGRSKKEAEQLAAKATIEKVRPNLLAEPPPAPSI